LDPERRRVLSEFYREEFLRHLQYLETSGLVSDASRQWVDRARRRFLGDLDRVCCSQDFPALAETLLQNFDALTRLSQVEPRQGH
jgi:hypothetical protein